jgi:hypothetical protein
VLFFIDGLTTPVTAALKPAEPDELPPPLPLLVPLLQAATARVATAPNAASPMILCLRMIERPPSYLFTGRADIA